MNVTAELKSQQREMKQKIFPRLHRSEGWLSAYTGNKSLYDIQVSWVGERPGARQHQFFTKSCEKAVNFKCNFAIRR